MNRMGDALAFCLALPAPAAFVLTIFAYSGYVVLGLSSPDSSVSTPTGKPIAWKEARSWITVGMTTAQVETILGQPDFEDKLLGVEPPRLRMWSYWFSRCMDVALEGVSNWSGVRAFQEALRSVESAVFPVLLAELPNANGGQCPAAACGQILAELDRFDSLERVCRSTWLVNSATGDRHMANADVPSQGRGWP